LALNLAKSPPPPVKAAQKPAAPPPALAKAAAPAKAPAPTAARGAWRVQLGAFSARASAEGLFKKLSGSGALAGRQAFYVPVGKITRLQAGPFESRSSAASACARLAPQPCFPVEAR
jgi:cell division septation protein DedD